MSRLKHQGYFSSSHHVVVVVLVALAGTVLIALLSSGWHMAQVPEAASITLQLDPNVASVQELAAIPGLGPEIAGRIVAYRNKQLAIGRNPVFAELDDLDRVEGIGKATLDAIGPSLHFESSRH